MNNQRNRVLTSLSQLILDASLIIIAFVIAYQLREAIDFPKPLANSYSFSRYLPLLFLQIATITASLFFQRQYVVKRAISRIDQLYALIISVTAGILLAVGLFQFLFKNSDFEIELARMMSIYAWVLTILFIMFGRISHQFIIEGFQLRGWGKDRLLIVGTGDVARIILQRILWSPNLGYEVVGLVNGKEGETQVLGIPILGMPEDLPRLIEKHQIDEVIIAIPDKGHREVVRVLSYAQQERVTIKIFPDVFQFVTSQANIDDLGGLPLLAVRDYGLRGYLLVVKRLIDLVVSAIGLIFISPILMVVAVAIKIESPGPVFFIQERMGLDGKPFKMIKFRSMRQDAEADGPGWTVDNDPRQTKLGSFIRLLEIDELPQLINVFLGEMSLVGPRPEQLYYVEQFREIVPQYMERHREKAGMTGWAQISGLRGDTSVVERTKYDLWYTQNWSILLDIKIILRTIWHVFSSFFPLLRHTAKE